MQGHCPPWYKWQHISMSVRLASYQKPAVAVLHPVLDVTLDMTNLYWAELEALLEPIALTGKQE